ncbi:Golgi apparatus membrane protein TVP38 [Psilocybe cubensis]|uniref:Golgi apparatus membrane protein TVP38 n=2 Tax=Psilocybe cubensis TaxID=181762 RepID=A0ACB8H4T0_PSICU|nr:Golgi apparatus membrane protein TVP38 [Psilocybe cubensis]KAH9482851.1 Golgi apparatus membrane protein TVP38 [Psilocybe cubensis]
MEPIPDASPPRVPLRYPSLAQDADQIDEKAPPTANYAPDHRKKRPPTLSPSPAHWSPYYSPDSSRPYPSSSRYSPHTPHIRFNPQPRFRSSTRPSWLSILRPWLPLIMYAITSLAFVVAVAMYRTELFTYLDELSLWLRADEQYGHAVLFFLIFLTTIPPIPLYSTLIVLSGYTFGPWTGAIISYFAALSGALIVFIVSRLLFRESIERWLASCTTIKRVVRAIEKRPKLLFLIRLAPYPYNVMNCLLAASPTLTLHTYTVCTALSLFKVIIHTSVGASIHSFRDYHNSNDASPSDDDESGTDMMARLWTILGILLCVLILVYLSVVARRAVDEELDDGPITAHDAEETRGFLSGADSDPESGMHDRPMSEIPFRGDR